MNILNFMKPWLMLKLGAITMAVYYIFTFSISSDEASVLLADYVNNKAINEVTHGTLGGTFPANEVYDENERNIGVKFWYCLNTSDPQYPRFFLVAEKVSTISRISVDDEPGSDLLVTCDQTFAYRGIQSPKPTDMLSYIRSEREHFGCNLQISKADVIKYTKAFRESSLGNYAKYPFCFFFDDNSGDFKKLVSQPDVSYIRYFMGFDEKESVNQIRVVLMGVDSKGFNVAHAKAIILQKSIPPPPGN